jgi:hypothetical protein
MAGGGTTVTKTEPWEEQKPYLEAGFKKAGTLYDKYQGKGPSYYGGPTLAGFSPLEQDAQRSIAGYAMGPRAAMQQAGAERAMIGGLGGQVDYSQFQPMADVYRQQAENQMQEGLANVRQGMVGSINMPVQPGGGSRGDLAQERVLAQGQKAIAQNLAGLYGGAYTAAQERVPQFMQQYPSIMAAPLSMAGAVGGVGEQQRAMTQEQINRDMARDQYQKKAEQQALGNYMNMVSGNYGGTQTQTAPSDPFGTLMSLGSLASGLGWNPLAV